MTTTVHPTALDGVVIIEPQVFRHERGFFVESNHQRAFAETGLPVTYLQNHHSHSRAGVLRGLRAQNLSVPMAARVRCTRGVVFDSEVNLQVGSPVPRAPAFHYKSPGVSS